MENFENFFKSISASDIWQNFFGLFEWIDWLVFCMLVWAFIVGIRKGFSFFFLRIIELLLTVLVTLFLAPILSALLAGYVPIIDKTLTDPVSLFVVFCAMAFFASTFFKSFGEKVELQLHPLLNGISGILAGSFYVLLLVSVLTQFILALPASGPKQVFLRPGKSISGPTVRQFAPVIYEMTLKPLAGIVVKKNEV